MCVEGEPGDEAITDLLITDRRETQASLIDDRKRSAWITGLIVYIIVPGVYES